MGHPYDPSDLPQSGSCLVRLDDQTVPLDRPLARLRSSVT